MKDQNEEFKINTKIAHWPIQAKLFASVVFFMIATGLFFAMLQVTIHDIIPTFQKLTSTSQANSHGDFHGEGGMSDKIGDLLSGEDVSKNNKPFYKKKEFLFALKFTHIHIFGMGLLFMITGSFVIFFDINPKIRNALIILPFVGILLDLLAVWLKAFISPYFFFLHIPGGLLFVAIFVIDFLIAYNQMWWKKI